MAEQKPFPPLSPSMLRTWGNTLPLSGTGQLTMDTALTITLIVFIAAFISAGLVIQFTVIRKLKEKLHEQEEEMGQNYSNAAEADRDLRQELYQTQRNSRWLAAEVAVRKFLMRDPQRIHELHQLGHLDRQQWLINKCVEIVLNDDDFNAEHNIVEWWKDRNEYNRL